MSTSSAPILFTRGTDKIYLGLLVVCLIYVFWASAPFSPILGESTLWVDESQDTLIDNGTQPTIMSNLWEAIEQEQAANKDPSVNFFPKDEWMAPKVDGLDEGRMNKVEPYLNAILDPHDDHFGRLECPRPLRNRYRGLRRRRNLASRFEESPPKRYFFALNLYQCIHVLPRLMASVIEAIRFLRPEDCVLSIVGGRSDDGTTEVLNTLRYQLKDMNLTYYFSTSDIDPLKYGNDRIMELAKLRNLALDPLIHQPELYSLDTTVVFLNDVSICVDDILELIYQKVSVIQCNVFEPWMK